MNTRLLLNIGLAIVVAALIALVVYEPGHERTESPVLTRLTPRDVTRISIDQRDETTIVLEKSEAGWAITSPIHAVADELRIQSLLGVTEARSHGRYEAGSIDLSKYDLAPPKARLRLNDLELAFGDTEPVNHRRYVRVGDEVHLITDRFFHHLITDLSGYLSPMLLPPNSAPVRLQLPELTLQKTDAGWETTPGLSTVSMDHVNALAEAWKTMRATRVTRHEQGAVRDSVVIELASGTELRFDILAEDDGLTLVRPDLGMEYHLPNSAAEQLLQLPQGSEADAENGDDARAGDQE